MNHPFATRQSYSSHAPPGTRPPARTSAGSARPIPNQPRRPLRPLRTPATGPDRTGGGHFTGFEADEKANRARRVAEQMSKNQEPYREPHYIPLVSTLLQCLSVARGGGGVVWFSCSVAWFKFNPKIDVLTETGAG